MQNTNRIAVLAMVALAAPQREAMGVEPVVLTFEACPLLTWATITCHHFAVRHLTAAPNAVNRTE